VAAACGRARVHPRESHASIGEVGAGLLGGTRAGCCPTTHPAAPAESPGRCPSHTNSTNTTSPDSTEIPPLEPPARTARASRARPGRSPGRRRPASVRAGYAVRREAVDRLLGHRTVETGRRHDSPRVPGAQGLEEVPLVLEASRVGDDREVGVRRPAGHVPNRFGARPMTAQPLSSDADWAIRDPESFQGADGVYGLARRRSRHVACQGGPGGTSGTPV